MFRLTHALLAATIRQEAALDFPNRTFAVVDVRDDDYSGYKIRGALHFPYNKFNRSVKKLKSALRETYPLARTIIFHCHYSQNRGPVCAELFLQSLTEEESARWSIKVLDGGFSIWQRHYLNDPDLCEKI